MVDQLTPQSASTRAPSDRFERASDRVVVLGCAIDRTDMAQTVEAVDTVIAERGFARHVSINAAKLVAMHDDDELRGILSRCELASADGQPVVWASRLLGEPLPERVAGIDLMQELLALAERRGYRVYFLGTKPDVLARAVSRLRERHPDLRVAGVHDGYFPAEDNDLVAAQVAATRPDMVFLALPSPRKEYWLNHHGPHLGAAFVMGVGGSLDVIAGDVRRAPVVLQRLGLEWMFRLAQEPRRLLRRYLVTNTRFVVYLGRELVARGRR
jgi:N-acetylglucosaminyldiphosphoundecaprenol N-acetyl-beta-D-mannosaminyltransferase